MESTILVNPLTLFLSVFDHFAKLALKGLNLPETNQTNKQI